MVNSTSNAISTDSSRLGEQKSDSKSAELETPDKLKPKKRINQADLIMKSKEEVVKPLTIPEMKEQIEALNLIEKSKPPINKQIDLKLKRAFLNLSIAREVGKNRKSAKEMTAEEKQFLDDSMKSINEVIEIAKENKLKLAAAYYMKGLIEFEFDLFVAMQNSFIESLKIDNNTMQSPSIALMLGEQFFEDESYDEAIKYYQLLINKMNPIQKALANYKTSWCLISQKKYEEAEAYLIKNITVPKKDQNLLDESLRDLAFSMTMHRTDEDIISFSQKYVKDIDVRAKLLYLTLTFFHSQNPKDLKYKLVDEVLKIQKNKEERLKTIYYLMEGTKRTYASKDNIDAAKKFTNEFNRMKVSKNEKAFLDISRQLETVVEYFVKMYIDTYTDKVKNVEEISKDVLAENMIYFIKFSNFFFPDSQNKDLLTSIWIDLCVDKKNFPCLNEIEKNIDSDIKLFTEKTQGQNSNDEKLKPYFDQIPKQKELKDRVEIEALVAFEESNKGNDAELAKKYIEFLSKERAKEKETVILKKILAIYLKNSQWMEAERFLIRLYSFESTSENLYNLWLAQYKLQKCDLIVNSTEKGKYQDKKIVDIQRECFLVAAKSSSEKGNISAYKESLKNFLATNPDEDKKTLIYLDYFSKLVNSKDYNATTQEWNQLDQNLKSKSDFEPVRLNMLLGLWDNGDFRGMTPYVGMAQKDKEIQLLSLHFELSQNPINHAQVMQYWNLVESKNRIRLQSLLALTQSSYLLRNFPKEQFKVQDDKRVWLLAKYLEQRTDLPSLSEDEKRYFKELLPKSYFTVDKSKVEDEYRNLKFPTNENPTKYMKIIEGLLPKIKALRVKTLGELKKISPAAQQSLILTAASTEKNMADVIVNSPLPKELTDEGQKNEYRSGLQGLAKEFIDQSNEFNKLNEGIKGQLSKSDTEKKANELPEVSDGKWPWPSNQIIQRSRSIASEQSVFAALLFIERQWQLKKISEDDYYWARSGLLLSVQNSQVMRNYLRDELKFNKKDAIINKWKSL